MSIPPIPGKPVFNDTGKNYLLNDNTTFLTTAGSWVVQGSNATVARETGANAGFPSGTGQNLKITTTQGNGVTGSGVPNNGGKITVSPPGGFKARRLYVFKYWASYEIDPFAGSIFSYYYATIVPTTGTKSASNIVPPYGSGVAPYKWQALQVYWRCDTDTPSVDIVVGRADSTVGTQSLHIAGHTTTGPRFYLASDVSPFDYDNALVTDEFITGSITLKHNRYDNTNGAYAPNLRFSASEILIQGERNSFGYGGEIAAGSGGYAYIAGSHLTPGDLVGNGVNIEAGNDYVGLYISERDTNTVQMYSDWTGGYMMQLRHRGARGWSASDDGTVNNRIDSFFQWERTISGALSTGTNLAAHFQTPQKAMLDEVRVRVGTAPTGSALIVDVNDDGTTIFTTQANRPMVGPTGKNITSGGDSTDATTYTTASVTVKAGQLYVVSVENSHASAAAVVSSVGVTAAPLGTISGTSRSSTTFNGGLNRVSIWTFVPTFNYTGVLFVTFGVLQTGATWSIDEVTGVDTTTNHGVVQQAVGSGTGTTPLATLAAFASASNGTFAAHGQAAASATTPGTGWTELSDITTATPAQALETAFRVDNDTTADATITSGAWGSCAVELAASTSATSRQPDGGTSVAKDSIITVDIDQVGSTIAGSDLSVFLRGRYIW